MLKLEDKADTIIREREEKIKREEEQRRKKEEEERLRKEREEKRANEIAALKSLIFQAKRRVLAKEMRSYLQEVIEQARELPELSGEFTIKWALDRIDWIDPLSPAENPILSLEDLRDIIESTESSKTSPQKTYKYPY